MFSSRGYYLKLNSLQINASYLLINHKNSKDYRVLTKCQVLTEVLLFTNFFVDFFVFRERGKRGERERDLLFC